MNGAHHYQQAEALLSGVAATAANGMDEGFNTLANPEAREAANTLIALAQVHATLAAAAAAAWPAEVHYCAGREPGRSWARVLS